MTRGVLVLWCVCVIGCAAMLAKPIRDYQRTRASEIRAHARLTESAALATRLVTINRRMPKWASASAPVSPALLPSRVSEALASSDLAAERLVSLVPEPAASSQGPIMAERHRATLTLSPIMLVELGRFLAAWYRQEPSRGAGGWVVTSIDVTPAAPGAANERRERTERDATLRVVLVLESVSMTDTGGQPP